MRILVTGGCGYVGSHVVRALVHAGAERIVVVDNLSTGSLDALPSSGVGFVRADVGDATLVRAIAEEKIDSIVHLAAKIDVAESMRDPLSYYANNVVQGLALLQSAVSAKVKRFVLSSSAAVYGDPFETPFSRGGYRPLSVVTPITEEQPLAPVSPYGEGKRILERALESCANAYGIGWMALRYFNAAGATPELGLGERHDPETHLVPLAVGAALGTRSPLVVHGDDHPTKDGTCIRDYVHVRDLAEAHVLAIAHLEKGGAGGAVNLGAGEGWSVREVIDCVARVAKKKVPHATGPRRPGDPAMLVASNQRARKLLGWKPAHDLEAIVRDVVALELKARS